MGAAWAWPQQQPRLSKLLRELGTKTFKQPDDGGSTRVLGGTAELPRLLAEKAGEGIQLDWPVASIELVESIPAEAAAGAASGDSGGGGGDAAGAAVRLTSRLSPGGGAAKVVYARRHVVLAAPPKILAGGVAFVPPLTPARRRAMEQSRTWMVGGRARRGTMQLARQHLRCRGL